jgi:autotransporter-associated beta strand protein
VVFFETTHATTATLIANGGTNGGEGGTVSFGDQSYGDTARVEVFGNGLMEDATTHSKALTIGSLEGDGIVTLNHDHPLSVGGNNMSTTFSGLLQNPSGGAGSLTKTGSGTLTLTGANTYTGQTMVGAGTLAIGNASGSATGTGLVYINIGTLGGSGIVGGPLTIGSGNNGSATLAPALGGSQPTTLTANSTLTFQSNGIYACTFTASKSKASADEVVAKGVTITPGATFDLTGTDSLKEGSVLTIISNTSKTPISGTFSNLADGTILNVNGQNLQASYEGGDGNDLTLTVVP